MHIRHKLFTGCFARSVGVVGNEVAWRGVPSWFSKCPEMHKQVLENPADSEAAKHQLDEPAFHFSEVNYGDYG